MFLKKDKNGGKSIKAYIKSGKALTKNPKIGKVPKYPNKVKKIKVNKTYDFDFMGDFSKLMTKGSKTKFY